MVSPHKTNSNLQHELYRWMVQSRFGNKVHLQFVCKRMLDKNYFVLEKLSTLASACSTADQHVAHLNGLIAFSISVHTRALTVYNLWNIMRYTKEDTHNVFTEHALNHETSSTVLE